MNVKKIAFDFMSLGVSFLALIFLSFPFMSGMSGFYIVGYIGDIFTSSDFSLILFGLSTLLLFLSLLVLIAFGTVELLCDFNIIKNENLSYYFKATRIVLLCMNVLLCIIIFASSASVLEGFDGIGYFGIIFELICAVGTFVLITFANKDNAKDSEEESTENSNN